MTLEEEKDFAEKVIRTVYDCAKELHISTKKLDMDKFLVWLIDKIIEEDDSV